MFQIVPMKFVISFCAPCSRHILLVILTVKKVLVDFTKKNCKKQIRMSWELKK